MARFIIPPQPTKPKDPRYQIGHTGPGAGGAAPPPPKFPSPGGTKVYPQSFGPISSGGWGSSSPISSGGWGSSRVGRFGPISSGRWGSYNPQTSYGRNVDYSNWVTPQENIDNLVQRFNASPITYTQEDGKTIATRSMAKEAMPESMRGNTQYAGLYGEGNLTSRFVLPGNAFTGPTNIQRRAPLSDAARAGSYSMGLSGMTNPNVSSLNPNTYWPSSAFSLPRGANGMPGFGTVDYTTGRFNMPVWSGVEPYGRFDTRSKRSPIIPYPRRRY